MRRGEDRRGRQRLREEPRLKWRQQQQKESQIPPLRVPSSSLNLTHAVCPRSHATCLLSHAAQAHTECTNTVVLTRTQKQTGNQKQQHNSWKAAAFHLFKGSISDLCEMFTWREVHNIDKGGNPFITCVA